MCVCVLKEVCHFSNLRQRIRFIVFHCDICRRIKHRTVRSERLMQSVLSKCPLDRVLVDIYGPLPSDWEIVFHIYL